jgi:hypothetical protein
MNCAVEMDSDGMIYIPSFINICSAIQKLIGGDTHTDTQAERYSHKPIFVFSK